MLRNGLEPWHLALVILLAILLFGSKKLPEAARGLGKSMRILKSEARAMKADDAVTESPTVTPAATDMGTATATASPQSSPVSAVPLEAPADVA
jgi:sec-independent protein translocase protein TatA